MQIGMVGLGRMGGNMARRLARAGMRVAGYDRDEALRNALRAEGVHTVDALDELAGALDADAHRLADGSCRRGHRRGDRRPRADACCGRHRRRRRQRVLPRLPAPRRRARRTRAALRGLRGVGRRMGPRQRVRADVRRQRRGRRAPAAADGGARARSVPRLAALRSLRRRPFREDDSQRHRVRDDAGVRRGHRAHAQQARARARRRRHRRDVAPRQRRALVAARSHCGRPAARRRPRRHRARGRGLRRRPVDGPGSRGAGRARAGDVAGADDALREPGPQRLQRQAARHDAQCVRRTRGGEGNRSRTDPTTSLPTGRGAARDVAASSASPDARRCCRQRLAGAR